MLLGSLFSNNRSSLCVLGLREKREKGQLYHNRAERDKTVFFPSVVTCDTATAIYIL